MIDGKRDRGRRTRARQSGQGLQGEVAGRRSRRAQHSHGAASLLAEREGGSLAAAVAPGAAGGGGEGSRLGFRGAGGYGRRRMVLRGCGGLGHVVAGHARLIRRRRSGWGERYWLHLSALSHDMAWVRTGEKAEREEKQ